MRKSRFSLAQYGPKIVIAGLLVGVAAAQGQGGLTPPGGPTPTMKTLQQIEPRTPIAALPVTISQPGSYYVTTNLTGVAGQNGVTIVTSGVTLDLMGFELVGVTGSGTGVKVANVVTNIAVHNGIVRNWPGDGVDATSAVNCQLRDLRACANGTFGLTCGNGGSIRDCQAYRNGNIGLLSGAGCVIQNCTAENNLSHGIVTGPGSLVTSCAARQNYDGINLGMGGVARGNVGRGNGGDGIEASTDCRVEDNHCTENGGAGVRVTGAGNRIEANSVILNAQGIFMPTSAANTVFRNSARFNPGSGAIGSSNYVGAAGNDVGPIGSAATATSPWANISY